MPSHTELFCMFGYVSCQSDLAWSFSQKQTTAIVEKSFGMQNTSKRPTVCKLHVKVVKRKRIMMRVWRCSSPKVAWYVKRQYKPFCLKVMHKSKQKMASQTVTMMQVLGHTVYVTIHGSHAALTQKSHLPSSREFI